jgi:hypothetical protein
VSAPIAAADLKKMLDEHAAWLRGEADGARADLSRANLSGADLSGADLWGAYLWGANLSGANLSRANLWGADLSVANLSRADLSRADLSRANLSGADLSGAEADDTTTWPAFYVCPDFGAFTAWKKLQDGIVAEIIVPAEAKRVSSVVGRKCRAEYVTVVALTAKDGSHPTEGKGLHNGTKYVVGETVRPDSFNDDSKLECTNGIHFFITKAEAVEYGD